MAGYSGTPLPKKLGIEDGPRFAVKHPPDGFTETLELSADQRQFTATHAYTQPGEYTVMVRVTDKDGGVGVGVATNYIVIYDASGGFVTGGGWIESPAGAYVADPSLTGKAKFGLVSRYKRGATKPTGNTHFNFAAGGLSFDSDTYDWLVVNQGGANAQFKGVGTINGQLDANGQPYRGLRRRRPGQNAGRGVAAEHARPRRAAVR